MKHSVLTGISYLRIFSTVAVVWLHTCSTLTDNLDIFVLTDGQIKFYNAAWQMMYWAVPCFFMITGVLLLDPEKKITPWMCVRKYAYRLLLSLFIFGMPYAL